MALPPLPRPFDDDPHGKPAVGEWLVERCQAEQVAARADAETNERIGRLLDRARKAAYDPRAPCPEGITASDDRPEARDESGADVREA